MGAQKMFRRFALSAIALTLLSGHIGTLTDYSRVACLGPRQQLPVYAITVAYGYEDDDPDTPEDERDNIEGRSYSSAVVFLPGYVLTAAHSVSGRYHSITVHTPLGDREAVRMASDRVNDMSILKMDTTGLESLPLALGSIEIGQRMWMVGHPSREGPVSYGGPLLAVRGGHLTVGAPVFAGMSGGGIVGCQGGKPVLMGLIQTFNFREVKYERVTEDNKTIVTRTIVNLGTGNGSSYMMLNWFTEFALAFE